MSLWLIGAASLASGLLGALGMGAGTVLLLLLRGAAGMDQITAQGVNLLFFLPIAALSLLLHSKNHLVDWKRAALWTAVGMPGALLGVWLSGALPTGVLTRLFGVLLLVVGIRELRAKEKTDKAA